MTKIKLTKYFVKRMMKMCHLFSRKIKDDCNRASYKLKLIQIIKLDQRTCTCVSKAEVFSSHVWKGVRDV